jgi:hypothetical protein
MAFTVDISEQTADALVVDILTNSLKYLRQDIARLERKAELLKFESEDLEDFRELELAFQKVVKYYTPPDKWDSI